MSGTIYLINARFIHIRTKIKKKIRKRKRMVQNNVVNTWYSQTPKKVQNSVFVKHNVPKARPIFTKGAELPMFDAESPQVNQQFYK